jgi:bloom syndrome protein
MPVSGKPAAKRAPKSRSEPYPSTAVTSPLTPSSRGKQPAKQQYEEEDDFMAPDSEDEEDAFEPMSARGRSKPNAVGILGPPITLDDRMAALPEIHRVLIHQFVDEAKKLEEKIRNRTAARKPFFTEANLREMAIRWTVTLADMRRIPDINVERVDSYGNKFLPMIQRYYNNYNGMVETDDDVDIDPNHQDVIDLVTDGEEDEEDEEEEFELEDGMEEAIAAAESRSPFFPPGGSTSNSKKVWKARGGGRGGFRGHSKGKKNYTARKSNGSASGQSNAGVRKRNSSGGSRRGRGSSSGGPLRNAFVNQSSRGGYGGGGIGMMPT